MRKIKELYKKKFLWPCQKGNKPTWKSVNLFTWQVRVISWEVAHSTESAVPPSLPKWGPKTASPNHIKWWWEWSPQAPPGCIFFSQWNNPQAKLPASNVPSNTPVTCIYWTFGLCVKAIFYVLFLCQIYKLLVGMDNALPYLWLPMSRVGHAMWA